IFLNIRLTFCFTLVPVFVYRLVTMVVDIPDKIFISLGYAILAFNILMPAVCHCYLKFPKGAKWLALSAASFVTAILFRYYDMDISRLGFSLGSHFLWHIFGGISTWFLIRYVYESDNILTSLKKITLAPAK